MPPTRHPIRRHPPLHRCRRLARLVVRRPGAVSQVALALLSQDVVHHRACDAEGARGIEGETPHDVGRREVPRCGAAGIEHFEHPQPVVRRELARERRDEIPAQEAGGPGEQRGPGFGREAGDGGPSGRRNRDASGGQRA